MSEAWRKLCNEKLHSSYCPQNIKPLIISATTRLAEHVER